MAVPLMDTSASPLLYVTLDNRLKQLLTAQASASLVCVAGIIVYAQMPEHREWMLSAPREYLLGLLRLSLMIPLTILCFLISVSRSTLTYLDVRSPIRLECMALWVRFS